MYCMLSGLAACAGAPEGPPTLKSLEGHVYAMPAREPIDSSGQRAMQAYREFARAAPRDPLRPEALRRLGDYEMRSIENRQLGEADETGGKEREPQAGGKDYQRAARHYEDLLRAYPHYPGNDRVLYQLAQAHELGGELDKALAALDRLVSKYPATEYREEAQFRRGELLFSVREYAKARMAYEAILAAGERSPFHERSLYMHGWTAFKQLQFDEAMRSFFRVLDRKLIGRAGADLHPERPALSRADSELVDDTFRAVSLSLSVLKGPDSIPAHMNPARHEYEHLVYQELAALYRRQERAKDAADTFSAFALRYPTHPRSASMQASVIDVYQQGGFVQLALEAKRVFVTGFGIDSRYRQANPSLYPQVLPWLRTHLEDLALHAHASAQKSRQTADYQSAIVWYREYLRAFPADAKTPRLHFLLAETLYAQGHHAQAAAEYEITSYHYPRHEKSADAGYNALLSHTEHEKHAGGSEKNARALASVENALRFVNAYPTDKRAAAVMTHTAEKLYALRDPDRAALLAQRVLKIDPPAEAALRRTAWAVAAHIEFERGAYDRAESGYRQALALTAVKDPVRPAMTERLAASVYKQAEQARAVNRTGEAVALFLRVGAIAPNSAIRATAEYDAAALMLGTKDWKGATRLLEDFRKRYPGHALQGDVTQKLAISYLESGQWALAAVEFERLAAGNTDSRISREACWQSAELYEKAGRSEQALASYERYYKFHPQPFEAAIEARHRSAQLHQKGGRTAKYRATLKELVGAEEAGGAQRTDRSRYFAATATMVLAEPLYDDYRRVALVEPLKKNLKTKKTRMETALKAFGKAAEYGVADIATASTYRIAEMYNEFGRALMSSQRPKGLNADELEQYNVMLEEQAYPFEEKAIELHEVNVKRTANGIYDKWIRDSYTALGKLRPVRYAKLEKGEVSIDALR